MKQDLLEDENMHMNDKWNHVKETLNTICADVLGKKTFKQKDWISSGTMKKIQEKNAKQVLNTSSKSLIAVYGSTQGSKAQHHSDRMRKNT